MVDAGLQPQHMGSGSWKVTSLGYTVRSRRSGRHNEIPSRSHNEKKVGGGERSRTIKDVEE